MIWVTWRQHRASLLFGFAILLVLCGFLLATGHNIWSVYRSTGTEHCVLTHHCDAITGSFNDRFNAYQFLIPLFLLIPALVGIFWGAPLVAREIENGTHRLAWTQGITRRRWIATKLTILLGAAVAGLAGFTYTLAWWSRPFVATSSERFNPGIFDLRGVVPIAYVLFAVALGVAAGTIMRRTVAAMGVTLVAFVGVRTSITLWARQHFATAKKLASPFPFPFKDSSGLAVGPNAWVISSNTVDRAGHLFGKGINLNLDAMAARCPGLIPGPPGGPPKEGFRALPDPSSMQACIQRVGLQVRSTYQPGTRYWPFQAIESAIFIALAAGLIAFSIWWLNRRVS